MSDTVNRVPLGRRRVGKMPRAATTLVATAFLVAGCGSFGGSTPATPSPEASASGPGPTAASPQATDATPVTLEFWNTFSEAEIALLHEMGEAYMKENPRITINFFEIPFAQRETKIPTAAETDSLPDIIRADYPYQWFLAQRDKLAYLDDYLAGWEMRDRIYDAAWDEVTYNGRIVGVPQDKFTDVFTYNKDVFAKDGVEAFPQSWDELVAACEKLTHGDQYCMGWYGAELYVPLLLQAGGQLVDDSGKIAFNSEQGVAALQFMLDLVNKYKVVPPGIAGWDYATTDNALKSQNIAMAPLGSWIIGNYRSAGVEWQLGIGAMPAGPGGRGAITSAATYMVTSTSAYKQEAVDLVKYLVSPANALKWAKTLDHEPIDEGTAADPYFQTPLFEPFAESTEFATTQPKIPEFQAVLDSLNAGLQKALLGQATPKEALDEAAEEGQKALDQ